MLTLGSGLGLNMGKTILGTFWPSKYEDHEFIRGVKRKCLRRTYGNPNENWAAGRLQDSPVRFNRQRIWGGRVFDFWNAAFGIAVEIDGPEHEKGWLKRKDALRDRHNLIRSKLIVFHVKNMDNAGMDETIKNISKIIAEGLTWEKRRSTLPKGKKARRELLISDGYPRLWS